MTESEVKQKVTSTEFLRHQIVLDRRRRETTTSHWYMALLASLLTCLPYRVWGQDIPPGYDQPSKFLLKFGSDEEIQEKEDDLMSEEESARYAELQKAVWLGIFGMDKDGNKVEPETEPVRPVQTPVRPPPPPPRPVSKRPRVQVITSNGH